MEYHFDNFYYFDSIDEFLGFKIYFNITTKLKIVWKTDL